MIHDQVRVRVPATSANLGPGFDTFGLALARYDELSARAITGASRVDVRGEGAGQVPGDDEHLVVRAIHSGLEHAGAPTVGIELNCHNRIPHGRGLGSSAAAVVAGLLIARELIDQPARLDDSTILELATEFEGHPDNAAPAIVGGATISYTGDSGVEAVRIDPHPAIEPVIMVPQFQVATRTARSVLPRSVPHADAVFNVSRAALLTLALTERPELLWEATRDRLHQPYRVAVMEKSTRLLEALRAQGSAAVISGAGPTVLSLNGLPPGFDPSGYGFATEHARIDTLGASAV